MRPKLTVDRTEMQQSHSIQKEDEFPSAKGHQTIKAEIKTSVIIKKKKKLNKKKYYSKSTMNKYSY